MALHYNKLSEMADRIDDPPELVKVLNKFLMELRQRTPQENVAQIIFGNVHGCKEFAWMFPYIRSKIDQFTDKYKAKLITTLSEVHELGSPTLSQTLLR